ncbi:co-chaperone GroES [Thermostilla marina]
MKLVPLGNNVIIKPLEAEETTPGGIVLPDSSRERSREGRVLAVGDGRLLPDGSRAEPQVCEGDRVIFNHYAGSEVQLGDEKVLVMSEGEILAVIE